MGKERITMPFKKGQSGNPGGRPKMPCDVQSLLKRHTKSAILTLVEIMLDKQHKGSERVAAAVGILRKVVPDLASTEIKGDVATFVMRLPEPAADTKTWAANTAATSVLPNTDTTKH
jgi:hypothetical protein